MFLRSKAQPVRRADNLPPSVSRLPRPGVANPRAAFPAREIHHTFTKYIYFIMAKVVKWMNGFHFFNFIYIYIFFIFNFSLQKNV
jgi:hypothetical protein